MAEYVEFYIDRGADFSTTIYIEDDSNNMPQDLLYCNVRCWLKRSLVSPNASAVLTANVSNVDAGEITVSLDAANTKLLKPGTYFYDIKITDTDTTANTRLIEGPVYVSYNITD
jgi:hypothetical protein